MDNFEQLIQKISPQSKLLRVSQLEGGISAQMTALEIQRADGSTQKIILRRPGALTPRHNPIAARDQFHLLQRLHSAGITAPTPIYLDESKTIFPTPYLVIEYIKGHPEYAPTHTKNFAVQCATQLARIHQIDIAKMDLSFLPAAQPSCGETLSQGDTSFEIEQIQSTLDNITPLSKNQIVLLHGDFWAGNLLWQGEQLAAVIDWEDAMVGDPLIDFAISRFDMLWIFGHAALNEFTQQYQSLMPIDYSDLPYWDLCAVLRLLRIIGHGLGAWASYFHPYGRTDITEQTFRAHTQFFIRQALERIAAQ